MLEFVEAPTHSVATDYLYSLGQVLERVPNEALSNAIELLLAARASGRRVYIIGNGGSAATASHFVCDLVKTAKVPGHRALRAFSLSDSATLMTAWANDRAYHHTFAEQILALVEADDIVIAISASGNSPNIIEGLKAASVVGAQTIALVGFDGGAASTIADVVIHVPCNDYGLVEDTHAAIGHAMTAAIRTALLPILAD